jgi:Glycosyl transferases group 1
VVKILSTVVKNYYNLPDAIEPMFLAFTHPLVALGHQVEHFDHVKTAAEMGRDVCGERFVAKVKNGNYDLVLYQNQGDARNWMTSEAIADAAHYAPVVAWNTDDDWQWEDYTRHQAPYFSFMVTTYPHIYETNRAQYPNLLLNQWGCLDMYGDFHHKKDLAFTFAGQVYGSRGDECRFLRKRIGLKAFGLGSQGVNYPLLRRPKVKKVASMISRLRDGAVNFQQINEVWNRSKISYAPMGASVDPHILQIKSRAFEMGLSGTLMLCQLSPNLDRYYEPGKEFVPFDDLDDCVEKARFYLRHDNERTKIAAAYYERTRAEHLWQHRYQQLFRQVGAC